MGINSVPPVWFLLGLGCGMGMTHLLKMASAHLTQLLTVTVAECTDFFILFFWVNIDRCFYSSAYSQCVTSFCPGPTDNMSHIAHLGKQRPNFY